MHSLWNEVYALQGRQRQQLLCKDKVSFKVLESETAEKRGRTGIDELALIMEDMKTTTTHAVIEVDGLPCQQHGCCRHRLIIRPRTSDVMVLQHAIQEYRNFLEHLQPHFDFDSILDAGGNIGIATMVFAFLYPEAVIVALEPEPRNCLLLKANTLAFPNVRVHCNGLWSKNTLVKLKPGGHSMDWAWRLEEADDIDEDTVPVTTIPELLKEHKLSGFSFVKADIEGAEFKVFTGFNMNWTSYTQLIALEIHEGSGKRVDIEAEFQQRGYLESFSGEYTIFARPALHAQLSNR